MTANTNNTVKKADDNPEASQDIALDLNGIDALSQYLKSEAGTRQGRSIPPLEKWHPEQIADMDLVIKANGEWWHEGGHVTRESLVSLFATILWKEEQNGIVEYFLKTPVQKLRISVEDVPLLINDVGIVTEDNISWLEFTTTTGDVVRLDEEHAITLRPYLPNNSGDTDSSSSSSSSSSSNRDHNNDNQDIKTPQSKLQIRPYMLVRNGLTALIGRNTFYHLTEIGELIEQDGDTVLTLQSGGRTYSMSMPTD